MFDDVTVPKQALIPQPEAVAADGALIFHRFLCGNSEGIASLKPREPRSLGVEKEILEEKRIKDDGNINNFMGRRSLATGTTFHMA